MTENYFLFGYDDGNGVRPALQRGEKCFMLDAGQIPSFEWLLKTVSANDLIATLESAITDELPDDTSISLADLLTFQSVWASGVTYKQSEEARERESDNSTLYTQVYNAVRPELFSKAIGYEVVSQNDDVGIRADATWSVPEPELTLVINANGEVFGFTIGNDMSSRDIEGENALYLPQAKVYDKACALGPRIWLNPGADSWGDLNIAIEIERAGEIVFSGTTATSQLKRTLPELKSYLLRCKSFPYGVFLMTGTGVVPPDDFTLAEGDIVRITIDPIGTLSNTVQLVGTSS